MEVEIIKAKGAGEDTSMGRKIDRLRVAAYCRVSTDDEDQIKSYNSMVRYYTDLIKSNKQWVFAGVFADKAITGTKTDKREEFQLLIQECLSGNIDLVIAKSIPRFARNTLDTLKYVRMLRERNIAVYFEVEKINTLKDGEFLLTILSSVAQQEVENTSAYVKKGLKMKMKRGELVGFQGCLGYDYDVVTKSLSINEEGAETVRYIFDRYVAGAGSTMIARELNEQGISTIKGNPWTSSSVMGIINNEKYKGDILLGKTFTVDPISKRRLENLGEEDRFYIKNHHEPIVSEETFARAQEIRERRNGGRKKGVAPGKREKFSRQYAFSCMLECGFCGASLSRRRWHSSSKYKKTIWQCVKSTKHGKRFCPDSKGIPEQVIEDAFIESYRMLCTDHRDVLEEFIKRVEKTLSEDSIEDKIEKLNKSAYNIQYKRKKLLENYLEGVVAKDIYEETDMGYEKKLSEINAQLSMLEQQYDNEGSLQRRLADFRKALSKNQILEEFDRGIFESIIEKVIVGGYDENGEKDPYKIIFIYKTGFKNEIGNAKERFGKKSKAVETAKEMCSHIVDEVKDVCSYVSDNTGGGSEVSVDVSLPVKWQEDGQAFCHVVFEFNNEEIVEHCPVETWHSGKHILSLYYPIEKIVANYTNTFNVYLWMENGSGTVDVGDCIASVSGQAMAAGEAWDGKLEVEDYTTRFAIGGGLNVNGFRDSLSMQMKETVNRGFEVYFAERAGISGFCRPVEMEGV